jgi:preprotein translocase subunit YajC
MLDLSSLMLLAFEAAEQAAPDPQKAQGGGSFVESLLFPVMICLILAVFFFARPREDKKQKQLVDSLKKNDRVVTIGGVYGVVANVKPDSDEIVLKIDEDKDVKITVMKSAILRKDSSDEGTKEKAAS